MSALPKPAEAQKREIETNRKLNMVCEWLDLQARMRRDARTFGRQMIEIIWEAGGIKRVKITDEVTIDDLSDKEREFLMRHAVSRTGLKPEVKT